MKTLIYSSIVSIFIICSCTFEKKEISMVGKWYRFSPENGYSEFEIDSQYVVVYSEKLGKSVLEYKIENDSFKYLGINYSAKITPLGDSIRILVGGDRTAQLIRVDESVRAFESVPDETDSIRFSQYLENFMQRADDAWIEAGFIDRVRSTQDTIKILN
jgi:hypothetical protein